MSTHFWHVNERDFLIRYRFDNPGDGLPEHRHQTWDDHDIYVVRGEIILQFGERVERLRAGERAKFDCSQLHRVIATQPDTLIENTFLNGWPLSYRTLPASELEGSFERHRIERKGCSPLPPECRSMGSDHQPGGGSVRDL